MTTGFVALWDTNRCEYHASSSDEWSTTERIQGAFAQGRKRGNRTYGLYNCRWSSSWHYFTFWISPDLPAVADTIADLERAGDFKFADSEHMIGHLVDSGEYLTPGAWDAVPDSSDRVMTSGLFLSWRRRSGATRQTVNSKFALTHMHEVQMLGEFDCHFSTPWDRFTFWIAPGIRVLEDALATLEREGAFIGMETRATVGTLDRHYRFGNHLQTNLPWLRKEGTAT